MSGETDGTEPEWLLQHAPNGVLVTGMHRSGTSAVAMALLRAGLSGGVDADWVGPLPENPAGFGERRDLKEFNDRVLGSLGLTWDSPSPQPEGALTVAASIVDEGRRWVRASFPGTSTWLTKDPRISLLIPLWRRILMDRMVVVVVTRPREEVAWSLAVRNGMSVPLSSALWGAYMRHLMAGLDGLPVVVVDYEALTERPGEVLADLAGGLQRLGVAENLDVAAGAATIRSILRRSSQPVSAQWDDVTYGALRDLEATWTLGSVSTFPRFSLTTAIAPAPWEGAILGLQRSIRTADRDRGAAVAATAATLASLEEKLVATRADVVRLETDLEAMTRARAEADATVDALRQRMDTASAAAAAVIAEIRAREAAAETTIAALRERDAALERAAELDAERLDALQATADESVANANSLAAALADLRDRASGLEADLKQARMRGSQPEAEVADERERSLEVPRERDRLSRSLATMTGTSRLRGVRRRLRGSTVALWRLPGATLLGLSNPLFDASWYLDQYPDVREARARPYRHYRIYGVSEGRDPNRMFDTDWYLARNPDVAQSGLDPLDHYLSHGAQEGRDPSEAFRTTWYLENNPDVAALGIDPLLHFLRYGEAEGRSPTPGWFQRRTVTSVARPVGQAAAESALSAPRSSQKGPVAGDGGKAERERWRQYAAAVRKKLGTSPSSSDAVVVSRRDIAISTSRARGPRLLLLDEGSPGTASVDDLTLIAQLEAARIGGGARLILPADDTDLRSTHDEFRRYVSDRYLQTDADALIRTVDLHGSALPSDALESLMSATHEGATPLTAAIPLTAASALVRALSYRVHPPLTVLDGLGCLDDAASLDVVVSRLTADVEMSDYPGASFDVVVAPQPSERTIELARVATLIPDGSQGLVVRPSYGRMGRLRAPRTWCVVEVDGAVDSSLYAPLLASLRSGGVHGEVRAFEDLSDASCSDLVVFAEPGVALLPGATHRVSVFLDSQPNVSAVAVKMLTSAGTIESAGVAVLANGDVAMIAGGEAAVRAAWHDYARDCCWGTGILVLRPSTLARVLDDGVPEQLSLGSIAARVWRTGLTVRYNPNAVAVRVAGVRDADPMRTAPEEWHGHLRGRPAAPPSSGEAGWRALLVAQGSQRIWP